MDEQIKALMVDVTCGYYRLKRYKVGDFFGPVDLGLHLSAKYNSLNIGVGLLAGSIFPGTNRLIFTGFSPCWGGFYISSMGGAGLVFDNLGINLLSLVGKSSTPSVLYLNRSQGEEIELEIVPISLSEVWESGRGGFYGLMDSVYSRFGDRYNNDPRILATGPAAEATDFGAIGSVPIGRGKMSFVDTWAGRGGFGSKMLQEHGIAAIIYGGSVIDEDFRDRKVADQWFIDKYQKKLMAKDIETTAKYRFVEDLETGGTFGVNFSTLAGRMISFNYQSIFMTEAERLDIHDKMVVRHYLKQFNEETIKTKQQKNCGEPCAAVCKKMRDEFKKDYEPYQAMGPLSAIFDQRAAEKLNHHADQYGFDAIAAGGIIAWLMECLAKGEITPEELQLKNMPKFSPGEFDKVNHSMENAEIGIAILDNIISRKGILDMKEGPRKWGRRVSREKGVNILDRFVFTSFGRKGWMVPNQYWTPGVLSPMAIMGKYYMHYGNDFMPPRELGRFNAKRFKKELIMDNLGMCRFHRGWGEEMLPEIIESLYGQKDQFLKSIERTATRINSRNASIFWESGRNISLVHTFLKRKLEIDGDTSVELKNWIDRFDADSNETALSFWYEIHKGITESLKEF
ncbi:aldehyde ferredoxin oxidoreductase [bacterium]|nr:aldehyde ferredoxin oxidoreductase [bacterium]